MKKQKLIKKQKLKGQLLNKTKNWKNLQNLHYNTSSGILLSLQRLIL